LIRRLKKAAKELHAWSINTCEMKQLISIQPTKSQIKDRRSEGEKGNIFISTAFV